MYKVAKQAQMRNYYTSVPCGVCPVSSQCCEGGIISPASCEYMAHWLAVSPDEVDSGGW
jgi:DNA-directed RNA polymerase III subunit RPC6